MKVFYKYRFEASDNPNIGFSINCYVGFGDNILEEGYRSAQNRLFNRFKENYKLGHTLNINKFSKNIRTKAKSPAAICDLVDKASSVAEIMNIVVPMNVLKSRYIIKDIREEIGCAGCCYESLGQLIHMDCPNGCLHEKEDCAVCNLVSEEEPSINVNLLISSDVSRKWKRE